MPSSWSNLVENRKGSRRDSRKDGGEGWEEALLFWTSGPGNSLRPHVFRDSARQNKFSMLASNQKWEIELRAEASSTPPNAEPRLKKKSWNSHLEAKTPLLKSKHRRLRIEVGRQWFLNYQLIVSINYIQQCGAFLFILSIQSSGDVSSSKPQSQLTNHSWFYRKTMSTN